MSHQRLQIGARGHRHPVIPDCPERRGRSSARNRTSRAGYVWEYIGRGLRSESNHTKRLVFKEQLFAASPGSLSELLHSSSNPDFDLCAFAHLDIGGCSYCDIFNLGSCIVLLQSRPETLSLLLRIDTWRLAYLASPTYFSNARWSAHQQHPAPLTAMTLNCTEPQSKDMTKLTEVDRALQVNSEDVVITDRGGIVENKHRIHAAIVDPEGNLLYAVGDPDRVTLARSAAKPIQALAILETGAADRFDFDDADIALMCASHSSEPRHISRAQEMLEKAGAKEEDLACGGHPALSAEVNRAWAQKCYFPTGICNNCSGKHAGMIAGAISLGGTSSGYHEACHTMQLRVRQAVEEMSGLCKDKVHWAIDGCNLSAPAMALRNLALTYARLAEARDGEAGEVTSQKTPLSRTASARTQHLARIHRSMSTYPDMVGGSGRFCTDLMRAYEGTLVGKLGADGCYGIAVRAPSDSLSQHGLGQQAIGIAVKVEDGNIDILYSAVMEILEQLDVGTKDMRQQLAGFHHPSIINTAGVVTGGFKHQLKVRSLEVGDA